MIAAIILAAGESLRMGTAKALLPFSKINGFQTTFLQNLIDVFTHSRAEPILVVLGSNVETIRSQTKFGNARSIINKNYKDGMLSSIQAGLKALANDSVEGALICPVDHPNIDIEVIENLITTFESQSSLITLPTYKGRRGHPVLFSQAVFAEIEQAPKMIGARQVVWDHSDEVVELPTANPSVAIDIDTPADYKNFLELTK